MAENKTRLEALADPVRLAIVRRLARAHDGQSLAELSDAAQVHPNTARGHLSALVAGRIVQREHLVAKGRGRPSVRYRLVPNWALPAGDLRELVALLAAIILRDARTDDDRRLGPPPRGRARPPAVHRHPAPRPGAARRRRRGGGAHAAPHGVPVPARRARPPRTGVQPADGRRRRRAGDVRRARAHRRMRARPRPAQLPGRAAAGLSRQPPSAA